MGKEVDSEEIIVFFKIILLKCKALFNRATHFSWIGRLALIFSRASPGRGLAVK